MPIQYVWTCSAVLKRDTKAYTEVPVSCVEDPVRGAESAIQRIYPIIIDTIVIPSIPTGAPDYVVRVKKEGVNGIIRPLADSVPASILNRLLSTTGKVPDAFMEFGKPVSIYVAPMEKVYLFLVNLSDAGTSDVTISFQVIAEKG
jgi:hypothetical protein